MRMTAIVEARNLQKSYGKLPAVEDVSFSIEEGEIFGLLGPNGAGKTTTIRMLSGLTVPDGGQAVVDGCDVVQDPVGAKLRLGVVPESSNLYMELSATENLIYMAQLYGMPKAQWRQRAEDLLRQFGLYERRKSRFQGFSRGMKRRMTIAAALVHRPRIVFLDEPTTGLDIMSARGLRKLIRELKKSGVTVLLTTHLIPEAEELCDRIAIIVKGKILLIDTISGIRQRVKDKETEILDISISPFSESIIDQIKEVSGIEKAATVDPHLRLYGNDILKQLPAITAFLAKGRINILSIQSMNPSLEDAFVNLTGVEAEVMKVDKPQKPPGGGA
jgi:ABC-2 type transport system ATP-binding protein